MIYTTIEIIISHVTQIKTTNNCITVQQPQIYTFGTFNSPLSSIQSYNILSMIVKDKLELGLERKWDKHLEFKFYNVVTNTSSECVDVT